MIAVPILLAALWASAAASAPGGPELLRLDGGTVTANLLANPSAESGDGTSPSAWSFEGEGEGAWDAEEASAGRRSLRVDGVGSWRSAPIPLQPGRVTLLAADTKLEGSGRWGGLVRIDFLGADGTRIGRLDAYLRDEHGWTRLRTSGVTPPGTVRGVVACYTYLDTDLRAWCDDIEVRQWDADGTGTDPDPTAAVRRFDFGTPTSEVQPGYTRVGPWLRYRPSPGHGWASRLQLSGRDQTHGSYRPMELDERGEAARRERTILDPLTRDYVRGVGYARFRVDVPPGRYRVFVLAGHSRVDETPPYFDLQVTAGRERAGRLAKRYPRVAFDWTEFSADVEDDGLVLGLSSDRFGGAWALSALVVYPEGEKAGRAEVERILRSVEMLPADVLAESVRLPSLLLSPAPAGDADRPGPPRFLAGAWPEPSTAVKRLAASAGPGLSADFQLSLRVPETVLDPTVEVAPFVGPGGERLPPESARLYHVRDRALRVTHGYIVHDLYSVQPDELSSRMPGRLEPDRPTRFWLRVRVPETVPAGSFRSEIRVRSGAGELARLPVVVRVLPFGADQPRLFQNVYFHGSSGQIRVPLTVGVQEEAAALNAAAIADVVDHLGDAVVRAERMPVYPRSEGGWGVELAYLHERIEQHRAAGKPARDALILLQPVLAELARQMVPDEASKLSKHIEEMPDLPAEYWDAFGDLVESIDADLRAAGVDRRVYSPWDEAFGEDLVVFARVARVLRARLDSPRIFCNVTTTSYYGGPGVDPSRALAPHCNAWWIYGTITDAQREAELARDTWLMGRIEAEGPALARAASGLLRWRRKEMGGNWWAYDAMRGSASTQLDGPSWGDRCLVYPTHPPAPRLAWEWTRVGHEDLRYLVTLERWVREAADDPRRSVRRAGRKGARLLARLRQVDPTIPEPLGTLPAYREMRREILEALERIHAARSRGR